MAQGTGRAAIAIHGGCGVMALDRQSPAEWAEAREALARALRAGWAVLAAGGRALDAVEAAVVVLEDAAQFNAGHGAVLNADGVHELDAAIMDGATLSAGAVCAARRLKNPVRAARAVLEEGQSVLLAGPDADAFAARAGVAVVDPGYFTTPRATAALATMRAHRAAGTAGGASEAEKHGTVGAVALDRAGHLAAATSTGGFTDKPPGRVGDSPIIGAGTYARDGACAVSGTGKGEIFIRHVIGHEIASRIAYARQSLEEAARSVVMDDLAPYGTGAGLVAVDAAGAISAPYNTPGMYRGWVTTEGALHVATHAEVHALGTLALR